MKVQLLSSSDDPNFSHSPLKIHNGTMNGRKLPALLSLWRFHGHSPAVDRSPTDNF